MDFLQQQGIEVKVIPGMLIFRSVLLHVCYCVCVFDLSLHFSHELLDYFRKLQSISFV